MIHETIQRLAENDNNVIYYICFDEYTLHQVQMHEFCRKISPNIICRNIADLSMETDITTRLLSLFQCLSYVENKHQNKSDEEKVHVIIDEFDGEEVSEEEKKKIQLLLRSHFFERSNLMIAIQLSEESKV